MVLIDSSNCCCIVPHQVASLYLLNTVGAEDTLKYGSFSIIRNRKIEKKEEQVLGEEEKEEEEEHEVQEQEQEKEEEEEEIEKEKVEEPFRASSSFRVGTITMLLLEPKRRMSSRQQSTVMLLHLVVSTRAGQSTATLLPTLATVKNNQNYMYI